MDDKLVYAGSLAKQIAEWKKHIKSENQDYLTGYICGLSVVEGMIADMPAIPAIPVEWLRSQLKNNPNDIESAYDDICINELIDRWQNEQEAR